MAVTRKVDKNKKISIPPAYLDDLGLDIGVDVEISLDQRNKMLIIKKGER